MVRYVSKLLWVVVFIKGIKINTSTTCDLTRVVYGD